MSTFQGLLPGFFFVDVRETEDDPHFSNSRPGLYLLRPGGWFKDIGY